MNQAANVCVREPLKIKRLIGMGTMLGFFLIFVPGLAAADSCTSMESSIDNEIGISYPAAEGNGNVLLKPSTFTLPPLGQKYRANLIRMKLCKMSLASLDENALQRFAKQQVEAVWGKWQQAGAPYASIWDTLGKGDIHFSFAAGYEDQAIKSYLLDQMVVPGKSAEVAAAIKGLKAFYVHLQIYDIGAEIIANDLILINPYNNTDVYYLFLEYVQA